MNTSDYRDKTWEQIQGHLIDDRMKVYHSLSVWGPVTTRRLAELSGTDILTVRPRVTELVQMGLARLADIPPARREPGVSAREGYYEAIPLTEAERIRRYGKDEVQTEMQLGGV